MARPKVPLIDKDDVVSTALALIDRDGLDAFSMRKLGAELGVNGASLYYHFEDKDSILHGVRFLVMKEGEVGFLPPENATWQEYLTASITRYRLALLRHPNATPLMRPTMIRSWGLRVRDRVAQKLLEGGVPPKYAYPIMDSLETLAYGSALLNSERLDPRSHLSLQPSDDVPYLVRTARATYQSADRLFRMELDAYLLGWTAVVEAATGERATA